VFISSGCIEGYVCGAISFYGENGAGGVGGVVEIRATDLLERAGIAANWVLMPIGRHLKIIK
tara:strand:- start:270 stop:455 length:186 start_codon:yes stop_codon:yes gene_type:complete